MSLNGSYLADRLGHYVVLTDAERVALAALQAEERRLRRGAVLIEEGKATRELFIVREGWLQSSILLGNGGRQIMRISLPGDVIGLAALAYNEAPETVKALTDVVVCPFDRERVTDLIGAHPRLTALLLSLVMAERTALADRLASVGRTSARGRIAWLLCDIFARLKIINPELEAIHVPLTQEEIGDATGLTAVHVNRMMRGLAEDGIIERQGNVVRLLAEKRLFDEANFTNRLEIATGWLPKAC